MKVIIQARMGSKRLPGKSMALIAGKPALQHLLEAITQVVSKENIVIATSSLNENEPIWHLAKHLGVSYEKGDEENVASRFYQLLKNASDDFFVRICGDSPLFDPTTLLSAMHALKTHEWDFLSTAGEKPFPSGMNIEIIKRTLFLKEYENFHEPYHFEHVTRYFYDHKKKFNLFYLNWESGANNKIQYRFTLDTSEDLKRITQVFSFFTKPHYLYSLEEKCEIYRHVNL